MDQPENSGHGHDAAQRLKEEAAKTLRELRSEGGLKSFFDFDRMYFPVFARTLFIVVCGLVALFGVVGIVSAFASMASVGFVDGCVALLMVLIAVVTTVVMTRVWIELSLVAFKINEGVQEIRDLLRNKWQ